MIRARPIVQSGPRPSDAMPLAGGHLWFRDVELLVRGSPGRFASAQSLPDLVVERLTAPRARLMGMDLARPRVMGILNVTPDSFSDGGVHEGDDALAHARRMCDDGADILDIGGESTRPGASAVPIAEERARVLPPIRAIRAAGLTVPISIDTRKAAIAHAAFADGAGLFNDVSALTFDSHSATVARELGAPVCLMHAQGDPRTMQDAPHYRDVLLDVYDWLENRIVHLEAQGISRTNMIVDPGIGFGKTHAHNIALLRGLSLFHGLGCPILLGASRKRFLGTITGAQVAADRDPASHAVMADALRQGVQIIRVHDARGAVQALRTWCALNMDEPTVEERG